MTRRRAIPALAVLFALGLTTVASPVQADDAPLISEAPGSPDPYTIDDPSVTAENPNAAVATTSIGADQDGIPVSIPLPQPGHAVGLPPQTMGIASASGCREISAKVTGKNILGDTQWTFRQTADWCWSGGKVTDKYSDFDVTSPGQWWGYKHLADSESSSGATLPWIRYRQAYFAECFPSWAGGGCYHQSYPWIRMYMYGNGTYTIRYGS